MKTRVLAIVFILTSFSACALVPSDEPSGHCYLFAAFYLMTGDIEEALKKTERHKQYYPRAGYIEDVLEEYGIQYDVYYNPTKEDFKIGEHYYCAVSFIRSETRAHAMVYDFYSQLFFDNGNCFHGCVMPDDQQYYYMIAVSKEI